MVLKLILWQENLKQLIDYAHGIYGVGYFLNVHEGPHSISKNNKVPLSREWLFQMNLVIMKKIILDKNRKFNLCKKNKKENF